MLTTHIVVNILIFPTQILHFLCRFYILLLLHSNPVYLVHFLYILGKCGNV